jgi:hypothetical protein
MTPEFHYNTVTEAITELRKRGFEADFNLVENELVCNQGRFGADALHIVDVYRYEGDSDPGDEAVVYALESDTGVKGILVAGFGASVDASTADLLDKLEKN